MQLSFFDLLFPRKRRTRAPETGRGRQGSTNAVIDTPFQKPSSENHGSSESRGGLERHGGNVHPNPASLRPRTKARGKSDPELHSLWRDIRNRYFTERDDLDSYVVCWSTRPQKRTLASCNIDRRRVSVARELTNPELRRWLEPLLYHEMCHAYLGMSVYSETQRSRWHGPEFRKLERRHPEMRAFDTWVRQGGWARAVRSDRARRARRSILARGMR